MEMGLISFDPAPTGFVLRTKAHPPDYNDLLIGYTFHRRLKIQVSGIHDAYSMRLEFW